MLPAQPTTSDNLGWLDDAACAELEEQAQADDRKAISLFFVEAGHVISEATLQTCRVKCPVRRECAIHAYTGGVDSGPVAGGYLAGFSLGQRRNMTLEDALAKIDQEEQAAQG